MSKVEDLTSPRKAIQPRCLACGRDEGRFRFELKGYDHFRCDGCGSVFVYPTPSSVEILRHYEDGAFYERAREDVDRRVEEGSARILRLKGLMGLVHDQATLLDVGCGDGVFLQCAKNAGFEAHGIEPSPALVALARTVVDSVQNVGIEAAEISQRFDVVTAWEVLEHFERPAEAFKTVVAWVKPGGLLGISTPLADGLPARVLGHRFPMFIPPEHLCLFSRRALLTLAKEHGLRPLAIRSQSNLNRRAIADFAFGVLPTLKELTILRLLTEGLGGLGSAVCAVGDFVGRGTGVEIWFRSDLQEE